MQSKILKNKRFLVVDDEPATVVTNPEHCLGMLAQDKYDGVILDRYMPQMDGLEVLKQVKDGTLVEDIPVIMLTGESTEPEIKKAIELGAAGYVVKPFTPKGFLAQLDKILAPREAEKQKALEEARKQVEALAQEEPEKETENTEENAD